MAIRNLRMGVPPTHSGSFDNWFADGLGATIRSELWACLAAGDATLAAACAREDALVDHAGDGVGGAIFMAALESLAFVRNDMEAIIREAAEFLPDSGRLKPAIADTLHWVKTLDASRVRGAILDRYGHENFTDCVMNLCFVVLALMAGNGDFGKSLLAGVNCGLDADCIGASVGAVLGILNPDGIPEMWARPIGRKIVLSPQITGMRTPQTLDEFTDMVLALRDRLDGRGPGPESGEEAPFRPEAFQVRAVAGFQRWHAQDNPLHLAAAPVLPGNAETLVFPGTMGSVPVARFAPDQLLLLRFRFRLEAARAVKVMFNTPENCRVWIDGQYAFGREGGRMAPSFHRVPLNQSAQRSLAGGMHEILAGIAPRSGADVLEWVIGVGDACTNQWLPGVFV